MAPKTLTDVLAMIGARKFRPLDNVHRDAFARVSPEALAADEDDAITILDIVDGALSIQVYCVNDAWWTINPLTGELSS